MVQLPQPTHDFGLEAVLQYISQLDVDDIDDLQARNARNESSLSDEELAKLLFAQEAESLLNLTRARIAGPSAVGTQNFIEELIAIEEMARFDHELALALSEDRPLPVRPELPRQTLPLPVALGSDTLEE